ncbi:MAG: PKD-like domain-containing protein, partial [Prolixibacteraceae bacterium]
MKKFQQSFAKPIIHMIIRMMIILLVFESFATSAYSQIATTSPASRCGAGTVTLGATGTGTIKWFTVPFYGTAVATGGSFTTPSMSVTKTYFVDAVDAANCSLNTNQARVPVIATISSGSIQAAIFYTSNTFCKSVSGDQLVTRTGTAGGAYSAAVGLTLNSSTGAITPSSSTNGVYTVRYHITIPASGCTENDATTPVTITTTPTTPIIRYAETPTTPISYCTTAGTITVDHTGAIGGTYSASPTGLTIDASTGTITTATSLSGTYTVTYFVPGLGGCDAMTAQATGVTILQLPTSAISYASLAHSYFAINQGTQLASLTGTGVYTGGTYSYTGAGTLTIVTTGEGAGTITPASSTAGTYTVTYTLASVNPCAAPTPATTIVTIYPLPTATIVSNQTVCQNSTAPDITFTGAGGTAPYTFTYHINSGPDQTVTTTSGNSVTVSQSTAVTGTFTYTLSHVSDANSSSQSQTGTATITVSAVSVALFSYEGTPYCSSGANPVPTMLEGGVKGTFSAASGVLFVSATTGEINLATSTAGTYTVTNTIAASGGCGIIIATSSVTITKLPVSTFTYGSTTYCQNAGTNPSPVLGTSAVTGIFASVPAGVVFVSATTGEIDLVNTPANAYQIVNTIAAAGGCADVPAHFDLTIGAPPSTPVINYSGLTYCSSISEAQPVELTGTSGGAFTYEVTSGGPTLTLSPTTGAITPITSSPGVYLITYTVGGGSGCAPVTATRSVTIYQTPVVTNDATKSICSGTNTNITLSATISSTFTWTLGTVSANIMEAYAGTGETISQELINTSYTEPGTVQYLVTPTSTVNGCVGAPYTITVTVNAAPQVVTTSPAAVCAPGSVNITLDAITTGSTGGLTFTYWPTFEANTTALSNPAAIAVSGTYYVKGSAGTGCYSVGNIIVVVNPLPVAPTAGNVTVTYDGAVHTGTASPPASASVVWYDAETGGNVTVAPQGTNYGTYTAYAESKAELTPTQCVSAMRTLVTVTINKASLAITANDATKPYGTLISGAAGSTEFTSSGLQNGETIGTVTIAYGTGSSANSAVATYTDQVTASAATGGTFTASNYTITYPTGAIIVGAKALAITANNNTKTYGTLITGGASSTAFTSVGLQNGETIGTVTIAFGTGSAADAAVTTYANQVNVSDATGGTFTASNYTITYPTGAIIVGA